MNNIIAGEAPESDDEEVYTSTVTTLHNIVSTLKLVKYSKYNLE